MYWDHFIKQTNWLNARQKTFELQPETLLHYTLHFYSLKLFLHNICCFLDHIALLIASLSDRGVLKRRRQHHQKLLLLKTLIRKPKLHPGTASDRASVVHFSCNSSVFSRFRQQMFKLNLVVPLPELLKRQIVKHYLGKGTGQVKC